MLKKFLVALAVMVPTVLFAQAPKFGVVDVDAIIPQMAEFAEANTKIQEASKTYQAEYEKINEELQKKYAEFQELDKDPNTLQSIKERRLQEMQELDQKAQQFAATAQNDLQRQQTQLMQPIQEKVMNAIKTVGAENGFTMILPEGVAAYTAADIVDVTPMVKAKLGIAN